MAIQEGLKHLKTTEEWIKKQNKKQQRQRRLQRLKCLFRRKKRVA